jgi:hypothetical protein
MEFGFAEFHSPPKKTATCHSDRREESVESSSTTKALLTEC